MRYGWSACTQAPTNDAQSISRPNSIKNYPSSTFDLTSASRPVTESASSSTRRFQSSRVLGSEVEAIPPLIASAEYGENVSRSPARRTFCHDARCRRLPRCIRCRSPAAALASLTPTTSPKQSSEPRHSTLLGDDAILPPPEAQSASNQGLTRFADESTNADDEANDNLPSTVSVHTCQLFPRRSLLPSNPIGYRILPRPLLWRPSCLSTYFPVIPPFPIVIRWCLLVVLLCLTRGAIGATVLDCPQKCENYYADPQNVSGEIRVSHIAEVLNTS